jgi:hypothetical protein
VSPATRVSPVTCLGCGCGCDDLTIGVTDGRIVSVEPPCPLARAWFGDGRVPAAITRAGRPAPLDAAVADVLLFFSVDVGITCTRSSGTRSSSATSWRIFVFTPCPISVAPVETCTLPSR